MSTPECTPITLCSPFCSFSSKGAEFLNAAPVCTGTRVKLGGAYLDELLRRGRDLHLFPRHPEAAFQARVLDLLLQQGHQVSQREQDAENQEGGVLPLHGDQQTYKAAARLSHSGFAAPSANRQRPTRHPAARGYRRHKSLQKSTQSRAETQGCH